MNEIFYADSSVLVKRHVAEIGSIWFQNLVSPASNNEIITATDVEQLDFLKKTTR